MTALQESVCTIHHHLIITHMLLCAIENEQPCKGMGERSSKEHAPPQCTKLTVSHTQKEPLEDPPPTGARAACAKTQKKENNRGIWSTRVIISLTPRAGELGSAE